MFLKKTRTNSKTYLQVVQSYRDEKGISRHKVVCNLGRLDKLRNDENIRRLILELLELMLTDAGESPQEESIQQSFNWE